MVEAPVSGVARALSNGLEEQTGEYNPQSILVTGGAGFIASHVVIRLCSRYPNTKVSNRLQGLTLLLLKTRGLVVKTCRLCCFSGMHRRSSRHFKLKVNTESDLHCT